MTLSKRGLINIPSKALLTLLLSFLFFTPALADQGDINGPPNSGIFGAQVAVLPNGNIVVTDPLFDENGVTNIGAVYLLDGVTHAVISTLKGSTTNDQIGNRIVVLANGNYVVQSSGWNNGAASFTGAVTFCSATTGCNGVVSFGNSLIGSSAFDQVGFVIALPNGNYVVRSIEWDTNFPPIKKNVGAVTFCNGNIGCKGELTTLNTIIGGSAEDQVGKGDVIVLKDGDYIVYSPLWHGGGGVFQDVGAVTFCRGTTGCGGVVSASNSLVGERRGERIGSIPGPRNAIVELANGNYVVASGFYNPNSINDPNPFGAVTLCNGVTGCLGTIPSNISLVGSANRQSVGSNGVTPLPNGNYVVNSPLWDNGLGSDTGAVTFCNGTLGCNNGVHPGNSLIGSTSFDTVGNAAPPGTTNFVNPVVVLSDGNYVVVSPNWDKGTTVDAGAVTWCSGTTGCSGPVSVFNSLVGFSTNDRIGVTGLRNGAFALKNGNYVVNSSDWDNPSLGIAGVGAVTFCNGASNSCANTVVSLSNSLTGTSAGDALGSDGTTALANGNYVVASRSWNNGATADAGAFTFCNGTVGCTGPVDPTNSLVGTKTGDASFSSFVTALPNGSYAVANQNWDNGTVTDAGAVTFCNGTTGCTGTISASNSLVGTSANDRIGVIRLLLNGNYVVSSPSWSNGGAAEAGAVTFCNGTAGCTGAVSASNSLVGSTASDRVGNFVEPLLNGNYVVRSETWDNGGIANAGAVTFGDGTSGAVGPISSANSVLGTVTNPSSAFLPHFYDAPRNRLFVGRPASNMVSFLFFETSAIADGNLDDDAIWSDGVPGALTNVIIPAGRTVTVSAPATIGGLSIANGGNLVMNADLKLTGSLNLGTQLNTASHTISLSCTSGATGQPANYVIGNLQKQFCEAGEFSYLSGTASGYSPVVVTVLALGQLPSSLTVKTNQGNRAGMNAAQSVQRYWTLTEHGDLKVNLSFKYPDGDVAGDESTYKLYKWEDASETLAPSTLDTNTNTISTVGISDFSDWTIGNAGSSAPPDGDSDGVPDDDDNCPATANAGQADADGDGQGNACDVDDDNDGVSDADEVAAGSDPLNSNSTPEICDGQDNDLNDGVDEGFTNTDGDGQADCVDADDDNDGQSDEDELACGSNPRNAASKSTDLDNDNLPDCVDPDDDGDGERDATDNCPLTPNPDQADEDGDQIGDACDPTPDGDIEVVFSSNRDGNFDIYGMKADGTGVVRLTNDAAEDLDPALSPDRSKIIFTSTRDGNLEIYSMTINGTGLTRLTSNLATDGSPTWSPKGGKIAFASDRDGDFEIYSMNGDGTGVVQLTNNSSVDSFPAWSPDASRIAFVSNRFGMLNLELCAMNADGTNVMRLTNHSGEDLSPTWSPDGARIAFSSTRNGNREIYSMNVDGSGSMRLTTNSASDIEPAWGKNGKLIFSSQRTGNFELYSMNDDGSSLTRLTNNFASDSSPHW
ncbi:MAG TPA: hypothetical protein VJT15_25245 [Pyrinomonadaceae bacterium]|nr:hypothetical protein [Pyrinomonadaceae bacterium]